MVIRKRMQGKFKKQGYDVRNAHHLKRVCIAHLFCTNEHPWLKGVLTALHTFLVRISIYSSQS